MVIAAGRQHASIGQKQRGPRFLVLTPGGLCGLERLLLELLGLGEAPDPSRDACPAVEREEAAFVIVGLDHLQRLVGELHGTGELTVERRSGFRQRRQRPRLEIARTLGRGLLRDDGHLVPDDR